ncbi:hypothetical protein MOVI109754_03965 [Moritella viscosa]|uniref:Uncharacterized protein n=1 Tax=Moritella viscosa TaxID=80854 RepID=A0ABY1HIA6_9GAMM|nr:Protein of unknown function (DUF2607) [Moritella viscosa]SGZ16272.1 Protein of unknown function (DUF2607) [Moritella viscosa]SHO28665.1 Protein of unknown function (DUF2607) [Moritella viscosa]
MINYHNFISELHKRSYQEQSSTYHSCQKMKNNNVVEFRALVLLVIFFSVLLAIFWK